MKNFTRLAFLAGFVPVCLSAAALPSGIQISPAPGSTLEQISEFSVLSGWLEKKNGVDNTTLLINGKSYDAAIDLVNYDELKFTLETPVNASGTYSVIVAENVFLMGWEGDPSPVIEFSYTVENDNGGGDEPGKDDIQNVVPEGYTFSPAAGSEVPVLTSFSVTTADDMFLTAASRKSVISVNGTCVDVLSCTSGDLGTTLTWNLAEPINTPGFYTIYIPEGTFYGYSETDNKPFIVTVQVTGGELPEPVYFDGEVTSDPAPGSVVSKLDKIAVQYPKLTSAYVGPEMGGIVVSGSDGVVDIPYTLTPDEDDFNEAHVVWLEFASPIADSGKYTIAFPARCFEIAKYPDNWYSAPFTLEFTVSDNSAVEIVGADAPAMEAAEYFTIGGARVSIPLSPGLYLRRTGSRVEKVVIR